MKDRPNRVEALLGIGKSAIQVVAVIALLIAIGYIVLSNPAAFGKGGDPWPTSDSDTQTGSNRIHSIRSNRGSISSNPNTRPSDPNTRPADRYACPTPDTCSTNPDACPSAPSTITRPADEYSYACATHTDTNTTSKPTKGKKRLGGGHDAARHVQKSQHKVDVHP